MKQEGTPVELPGNWQAVFALCEGQPKSCVFRHDSERVGVRVSSVRVRVQACSKTYK